MALPATGVIRTGVGTGLPKLPVLASSSIAITARFSAPRSRAWPSRASASVGLGSQERQCGLDTGVGLVGAVTEGVRMVGVGADTLESVEVEVAQTDDVGAQGRQPGVDADGESLGDHAGNRCRRVELGRAAQGLRVRRRLLGRRARRPASPIRAWRPRRR